MNDSLLNVEGLRTEFHTIHGVARAVDGVDVALSKGETLGVVGESGCGKTMLALSILRLVPSPPGKIVAGSVDFKGRDLLSLSEKDMRSVRGNQISMIFQEPMTSLNPVFTIGDQITEVIRLHRKESKKRALESAAELLSLVGIPNPKRTLGDYPHELSGGMRQRIVIAMALACDPDLILADEPTTALDVTIQAQILRLMLDLREKKSASIMLITHDLGVVAQTCDRVVVMYAGKIVESSLVGDLFQEPLHPYTRGLLGSLPKLAEAGQGKSSLTPISGAVPGLLNLPPGCSFAPRCPERFNKCDTLPPLFEAGEGRRVRCWLHDPDGN